jgi:hypothetical protein
MRINVRRLDYLVLSWIYELSDAIILELAHSCLTSLEVQRPGLKSVPPIC